MTSATKPHRTLLDADTIVERFHTVSVIEYAMRGDRALWGQDDETRRASARRVAFALWAIKHGEISDAE